MLINIKEKLSKFRSETHMGRYNKALIQGQLILNMLKYLKKSKVYLGEDDILIQNIQQQISLVAQIENMITQSTSLHKKKPVNQKDNLGAQSVNKIRIEQIQFMQKKTGEQEVAKWNKKKQVKNSGQETISNRSKTSFFPNTTSLASLNRSNLNLVQYNQNRNEPNKDGQQLLEDQIQIIQRQVILPLNLPNFFKNKEPHRLIISYYKKCNNLIKKLSQQIVLKKKVIQLQELKLWSYTGANQEIKIYVCPYEIDSQVQVCKILQNANNMIVMYSQNDRQMLTQKYSNIKKQEYRIKF